MNREVKRVAGETNINRRQEMFRLICDQVPSPEIPDAIAALQRTAHEREAGGVTRLLLLRWSAEDPDAAAGWALQQPEGDLRSDALDAAMNVKGARNLDGALTWAKALKNEEERERALLQAAAGAAQTAPKETLAIADDLPEGDHRDGIIRMAGEEWISKNSVEAIDWGSRIGSSSFRDELFGAFAGALAPRDPVAAATLVADEIESDSTLSHATEEVASRWAEVDPQAAADWVELFPESQLKNGAIEAVSGQWLLKDPVKAERWRDSMQK